jgi:hypothetical protein
MALKPDREELAFEIGYYLNEVAERGGICVQLTAGSGGAWKGPMGDTHNVATYAAAPSGKRPLGILMNDQVSLVAAIGFTAAYGYKDEMPVGGKCTLLRRGWVHTNKISGTPVGGEPAYVGPSGLITPTAVGGAAVVGQFLSSPDEDGYARVAVTL